MSERRRCAYRNCARRVPRPGALYCSASHRELASRDRRRIRAGLAGARATIRQLAKELDWLAELVDEHQLGNSPTRRRGGKRSITDAARWAAEGRAELTSAERSKDTGPRRRGLPSASQRLGFVEQMSGPSSTELGKAEIAEVARDASALPAPLRAVVDQVADFPRAGSMIWPDPY